jgi:hypothetical protein
MDLGFNENFDIELDDRQDIPLITGRRLFEQRVALRTAAYFHTEIGSVDHDNVLSLLEMRARRVARDMDEIEFMPQFRAEFDDDQPGLIHVTIIYHTGDEYTFDISE